MKIGIIGGGIAGTFFAMRVKELHPDFDVEIFEHNDKLLKKIYATGNGKCNFANSGNLNNKYTNEKFVLPIINDFTYRQISEYFNSLGIPNILDGNLAYPMSKSAHTVGIMMDKKISELGIISHLSTEVIDYKICGNCIEIHTNNDVYKVDKIVISTGGKSSPQLGSDGSMFSILKKHGYDIKSLSPSLCPIMVKENTKLVDGVRSEVTISIYEGNKLIHKEEGELLFKDKGISGIVIFNACHFINDLNKNIVTIHVDFVNKVEGRIGSKDYIMYVQPRLAKYLEMNNLDIHDVKFTFKDFYDYSTSQVTYGGIKLEQVTNSLESRKEPGVYFIGEVLDVDAVCGGYNMMWCFASAHLVSRKVK